MRFFIEIGENVNFFKIRALNLVKLCYLKFINCLQPFILLSSAIKT